MLGQRFTRLLVNGEPISKNGRLYWPCVCDCTKQLLVMGTSLRTGNTKSCGCLNRDSASQRAKLKSFKHGHSGDHSKNKKASPTYRSWTGMLSRCLNPNTTQYNNYGGRGIQVSGRWNPKTGGSFQNFLSDMKERPEGTTLEREDVNGNYEPDNCIWATSSQQIKNRRPYKSLQKFSDTEISAEYFRRNLHKTPFQGEALETSPIAGCPDNNRPF